MLTSQQIEKKRLEYEKIREQKRIFDAELAKHEVELGAMLEEHGRLSGHQSEPTTPPEYRENPTGFPSVFSRPNRYSLSSLTSPPGLANRSAQSGSVLASPQSGVPLSRFAFDDQLPSWSVPGSRRNSDEDEKEEAVRQDPTSHRSTNAYVEPFRSGPPHLVEFLFEFVFALLLPIRLPHCETRAGAVIGMGLWPSGTMPQNGAWRLLSGCEACKGSIAAVVSILNPSVWSPPLIALLLSTLVFQVTAILVNHDCPSCEDTWIRPISQWERAYRSILLFDLPFEPPTSQRIVT